MKMVNNFSGVTNEEFVNIFKDALFCRKELINYTYPHELLNEDDALSEHLQKCSQILYQKLWEYASSDYIVSRLDKNYDLIDDAQKDELSNEEIKEMVNAKRKEISSILSELVDKFREEIIIHYVNL